MTCLDHSAARDQRRACWLHSFTVSGCAFAMLACALPASSSGAEQPADTGGAGESIEGQNGGRSAPDAEELLRQTVELMRSAQERLAAGRLDDETGQLHSRIEANLQKLLQAARPALPQTSSSNPPRPAGNSPTSPGGGDGSAGRKPQDAAGRGRERESDESPREGALLEGDIARRENLATSVWGHLPPRLRDKMQGAFSDKFLPQYDDAVRRYYEALATDRLPAP